MFTMRDDNVMSITSLIYLFEFALGIAEAIFVNKYYVFSDGCRGIWSWILAACIFDIFAAFSDRQRYNNTWLKVGQFIIGIWSVVTVTHKQSNEACYNFWQSNAPELWQFVIIHFVMFWISIVVILLGRPDYSRDLNLPDQEDGKGISIPWNVSDGVQSSQNVNDGDRATVVHIQTLCNPQNDPRNNLENNPGHDPGIDPGIDPGHNPGIDPGHNPGIDPGHNPGIDPGHNPGIDPENNPGHDPGNDPITVDAHMII
jgi:hypothetical protein